jgi:hypothetical protein
MKTTLRTTTQLPEEELAFISLRLTFGSKPCPSEWCTLSEVTDMANALLSEPNWDPDSLYLPLSDELLYV